MIAWALMGDRQRLDPDAAAGASTGRCSAPSGAPSRPAACTFVSRRGARGGRAGARSGSQARAGRGRGHCRTIGKRDMIHNDALPTIEVDPGDLRGARRRRAADLRAGDRAAAGAALLFVLNGMRRLVEAAPQGQVAAGRDHGQHHLGVRRSQSPPPAPAHRCGRAGAARSRQAPAARRGRRARLRGRRLAGRCMRRTRTCSRSQPPTAGISRASPGISATAICRPRSCRGACASATTT